MHTIIIIRVDYGDKRFYGLFLANGNGVNQHKDLGYYADTSEKAATLLIVLKKANKI